MLPITVGTWRTESAGPMQVVSGPFGREKVHYVAPPAVKLDHEMEAFVSWFESTEQIDLTLKAAVAHLWFVTIHPFDDGNGRIARALSDMMLARSENSGQRFYGVSAQIQKERKEYYQYLESTQKGNLDITQWLVWFLDCLDRAIAGAESLLAVVLAKAAFWDANLSVALNDRQRLMVNKLFEGFDGKLTTSKWASITKISSDTALRDIQDLVEKKILFTCGPGGRGTSYSLSHAT